MDRITDRCPICGEVDYHRDIPHELTPADTRRSHEHDFRRSNRCAVCGEPYLDERS